MQSDDVAWFLSLDEGGLSLDRSVRPWSGVSRCAYPWTIRSVGTLSGPLWLLCRWPYAEAPVAIRPTSRRLRELRLAKGERWERF